MRLGELLEGAGPFPVPETVDPDAFWEALADDYVRLMTALMASGHLAAMLRGWLERDRSSTTSTIQQGAEQALLSWMRDVVAAGQRIGTVRTDPPDDLLLTIVMSLGRAMDTWLLSRPAEDQQLDTAARTLLGVIRRSLAPG